MCNAVGDGADCFVLTEETEDGLNPLECVQTIAKVVTEAEKTFNARAKYQDMKDFTKGF